MTTVGTIRWDAFYTADGPAQRTMAALSQPHYQDRAPFFSEVLSPNLIEYAPTEETMSQEIEFAVEGGLDYWAFLYYARPAAPATAQMMAGWDLFQANPNKNDINWCWIQTSGTMAGGGVFGSNTWQAHVATIVTQMQQANWQKVLTNRPLLYLMYDAAEVVGWFTNDANLKTVLDALRADAQTAGLGNPYIVILQGGGSGAAATKTTLGADAISSYIGRIPSGMDKAYTLLDTTTRTYWAELLATGSAMVPICMCGWDRRPRIERPVTWEASTQRPFHGLRTTHMQPTNAELVAHFQAALDFVDTNAAACPADTILAYAWNEHDEGGWLCPTLGDPTGSRLAALAAILT